MGLASARVSRDFLASDFLISRCFPHLASVFPRFCGVFPQKRGKGARGHHGAGEYLLLFKHVLTAFARDVLAPWCLVVGRPRCPAGRAISGWIGAGTGQLDCFDAPACDVAYWALSPSSLAPMSTERGHLQRCIEQDCATRGCVPPAALAPDPEAACISLEAEVPEVLFEGMREFLQNHPHWDQYRLISSALASFLFQNGCSDQGVTQHYLNGLFLRP